MDMITALGRLLRDGALRDELSAQPRAVVERLGLRATDQAALLAMPAADLEFQARVLLGKRFDAMAKFIPRTLADWGDPARQTFITYARKNWPTGANPEMQDAAGFCHHCLKNGEAKHVCRAELNRLNFALNGQGMAMHFVRGMPLRNKNRNAIQVFFRVNRGWRESMFYLGW